MTNKEAFIKFVEEIFNKETNNDTEIFTKASVFFEDFKKQKENNKIVTENGKKIITWMKENLEVKSNIFTSKEIAEGLFTSGKSVAGAMKKLVADNYVEKQGKDPIKYSLTDDGKNLIF